ncbi:MAG: ABC transporter permease [Candidatus Bathyarchaeia archaeon]|jgi:ABC-2 type transport system permease protein
MAYDFYYDVRALFARAMKKFLRTPISMVFSLLQPIIFLVLLTQVFNKFGSLPGFPAGGYLEFAVAGILFFNLLNSTMQAGISMVDDINSGYLSKILVTPVSRSAILLGRLLSDAVRMLIQSAIILVIAYLLGATFATGVFGILLVFLTVVFFGVAWSGIYLAVGLATKSSEATTTIGVVMLFPLLFISIALVPFKFLPRWAQTVSSFNPVSYGVNVIRSLMSTGFNWGIVLPAYAIIALVATLTWGATLYQFRKVVK